jgi:hypothetical protein
VQSAIGAFNETASVACIPLATKNYNDYDIVLTHYVIYTHFNAFFTPFLMSQMVKKCLI